MKLPAHFYEVHERWIERAFYKYGPIFRLIPKEPIGGVGVVADLPSRMEGSTVTVVTIRCSNDRGVVRFESFSKADLAVMAKWEKKYRNTPTDEFDWFPPLGEGPR